LYGGNSKQRKDWALNVAKNNGWNFWETNKGSFEADLYKTSLTSSLDDKPTVIFVYAVDIFSAKEMTTLFSIIEKSKQKFLLASKSLYKVPKEYREKCHSVVIGQSAPEEFFEALNQVMLNPNREQVREILAKNEKDVDGLLHILKNNIWKVQNEQAWHAIESCMSLMYKVSPEFQVSMLAYLFPVCKVPMSYEKAKLNKEHSHILLNIRERLKMNQKEALEQFSVIKELANKNIKLGYELGVELGLNDEERIFMGMSVPVTKQSVSPQILVAEDKGLEKWF